METRVTIKDIASAAGVSVATVSYIMNNTPGKTISNQTRNRVLAVAEELHYVPNTSAQRLKTNQAKCVAVRLSNNLSLPRYHNIIQGIRSCLAPSGYSILLTSFDERGSLAGCVDACMSGQADGMIYIAARGIGIQPTDMEQIQKWNIPVSAIDCMGSVQDVSSVVYDYYASSRDRMDILLENGYRKFLYLRPKYQHYNESAREQGVRSILMERSDISVDVRQLEFLDEQWYDLYPTRFFNSVDPQMIRYLKALTEEVSPDTAILCYSKEVQNIITRLLYTQYLRDPSPEYADWAKRSVSYHFPNWEAGVEAARSLLAMLKDKKAVRKVSIHPVLDFPDPECFV